MSGRNVRGQSLVEFALVLPLILLLFMGVFDFGRAIYAYNTISNAARDGARKAIVDQTPGVAAQEAAAQATALGLDAGNADPTNPNDATVAYRRGDGTACTPELNADDPCFAVVTATYVFRPTTPIIGNIIGQITLSSTTKLPIEFKKP